MSAGSEGLRHWQALFGERSAVLPDRHPIRAALNKGSLPTAVTYLTQHGLLTAKPRGEWVSVKCPVHRGGGETHASMRVSLADGHFFCHACGAKGGDLVALHRLVTGLGFRDAVADLGGRFHD